MESPNSNILYPVQIERTEPSFEEIEEEILETVGRGAIVTSVAEYLHHNYGPALHGMNHDDWKKEAEDLLDFVGEAINRFGVETMENSHDFEFQNNYIVPCNNIPEAVNAIQEALDNGVLDEG